mmetsp:Transcript_45419/g.108976  ORF Transcript_45419/g.108976 Transcript_45419/m.108976 type:complete len:287 (+) Transcript_45419:296-1156(+)
MQRGGHALQPPLAAHVGRHLHLQLSLLGLERVELGQRRLQLVLLRGELGLRRLELVSLGGVLQLYAAEQHGLLLLELQARNELTHHGERDVLPLLLDGLEVIRAEELAVQVRLRRPDHVVRVQLHEQAHGPRPVEALAVMLHLDDAIGPPAVAVVLHLVPEQDVGPRDVVLEALALVEEGHDRRAVRQRLLSLRDVERYLHHVPHGVLLVGVGGPHDAGEHEVRGEVEDAEDLQELLRRVEVHDLVRVFGRRELVMEEVLARAKLPLQRDAAHAGGPQGGEARARG